MEPLTVAIPPDLRGFVEHRALARGVTVDEFIASLLVLEQFKHNREQYDQLLLEALKEESRPMDQGRWARIRQELGERHQLQT
jgi:hypothetical protein